MDCLFEFVALSHVIWLPMNEIAILNALFTVELPSPYP